MRCIFFTKPKNVTLECLKFLVENNDEILGVVIDNKRNYIESEFYNYCIVNKIDIYDSNDLSYLDKYKDQIDMIYSNTFPKLISNEIINSVSIDAVNFHSSPLPKYRGVFGFNFGFLNDEKQWGVSAHKLDGKFDTGDVIEVLMFDYNFSEGNLKDLVKLTDKYILELFKKTHLRYKKGEQVRTFKQTEGHYYSRKDFSNAKKILESDTPELINKKIRAFWYPPYEGAYVEINGLHYPIINQEILDNLGE